MKIFFWQIDYDLYYPSFSTNTIPLFFLPQRAGGIRNFQVDFLVPLRPWLIVHVCKTFINHKDAFVHVIVKVSLFWRMEPFPASMQRSEWGPGWDQCYVEFHTCSPCRFKSIGKLFIHVVSILHWMAVSSFQMQWFCYLCAWKWKQ